MPAPDNPSVLIAGHDPAAARSLLRLVGKQFASQVVTELSELTDAISRYEPTMVLLDLMWGTHAALPELAELVARRPALRVCMHTNHATPSLVTEAFRLGARGYVVKPATREQVWAAIATVMSGQRYLSPCLASDEAVCRAIANRERVVAAMPIIAYGTEEHRCASAWIAFDLRCSTAESVVLVELAMGRSKRQIAGRIGRTESTVAWHLVQLYARYRKSHGLINPASIGRWVHHSLGHMPPGWEPG